MVRTASATAQRHRRVLLVDDDADIVDALESGLRTMGYTVDSYLDPRVALAAFIPDSYDVAVLDVRMRPFDGLKLYRRLKELDSRLAMCFLTAYADTTIETWPTGVMRLQKLISLDGLAMALEDIEARGERPK